VSCNIVPVVAGHRGRRGPGAEGSESRPGESRPGVGFGSYIGDCAPPGPRGYATQRWDEATWFTGTSLPGGSVSSPAP